MTTRIIKNGAYRAPGSCFVYDTNDPGLKSVWLRIPLPTDIVAQLRLEAERNQIGQAELVKELLTGHYDACIAPVTGETAAVA